MDSCQLALRSGQVLKRPLHSPTTGHVLLAAGVCLNPALIDKIVRLGVTEAVVQCLLEEPAPPPIVITNDELPPADSVAELQEQVHHVYERLASGEDAPTTEGDAAAWGPLAPARMLLEALMERMCVIPPDQLPNLRLYGREPLMNALNVALYAIVVGKAMGMEHEQLLTLMKAALLHDLGKRKLQHEFAHKAGKLSLTEVRMLEGHVEVALNLLRERYGEFCKRHREVIHGIRHQREHWDGSGQPFGLKGNAIPLVSRILAVAIWYNSVTTDRAGQNRLLAGEAHELGTEMAGMVFDPAVVEAFCRVVVPYPIGSILKLSSGQVAQVIDRGSNVMLPVIQLGFGDGKLDLAKAGAPRIAQQYYPRRHTRRALRLEATIADFRGAERVPAHTQDISLGGMCLITRISYQPGDRVSIRIQGVAAGDVDLAALVAWIRPQEDGSVVMGVCFQGLSAGPARWLSEVCQEVQS